MNYVELPVVTDQQSLQDDAFAYVQSQVEGFQLDPAHPMTWLIEACGRMAAVAAYQASLMPAANLRTLGQTVYGLPRSEGEQALAVTTWTAVDTAGYTVPAGATLLIDGVPFTVDAAVTIPAGSSSTAAGEVHVRALDVGTAGNGLGVSAQSVDSLAWLSSIAVVGTTAGGADAEDDETYQNRLATLLQLQAPRAITARDFEVFSLNTTDGPRAGVARAVALDNYDPANPGVTSEGFVAVALADSAGLPVATAVKSDIAADLDAKRLLNLVVNLIDATYSNVTIGYVVTAYDGFDKVALQTAIDAAITSYFSPATWGQPPFGDVAQWINAPTIHYLTVARVIGDVDGVEHINSLTVNGGTADVTMTGAAPLPSLQPITTHTVN
jgi:hypothetical protein